MTNRLARVTQISIYKDEFTMNPYVETVQLEPLNCNACELIEWLKSASCTRSDLGCCAESNGKPAIAYVNEASPYKVGDIVSISFEDYIHNKIKYLAIQANNHIQTISNSEFGY